jgi:hypothetical protein
MKITALEESADFATLDIEKLFSQLKSHELSRKGHSNQMLLSLVRLLLLVLLLMAMILTLPTLLSHLLWSLSCPLWLQLWMNSMRASPMMRLPCWQGSSTPYTSSTRRGEDHPGAASSAATPPTSLPTAPRGRSSTHPTSMTTPTRTTPVTRMTTRRTTASETRRRSFRRSSPEHVLP